MYDTNILFRIVAAAKAVEDTWESGDLAAAVRDLGHAREALVDYVRSVVGVDLTPEVPDNLTLLYPEVSGLSVGLLLTYAGGDDSTQAYMVASPPDRYGYQEVLSERGTKEHIWEKMVGPLAEWRPITNLNGSDRILSEPEVSKFRERYDMAVTSAKERERKNKKEQEVNRVRERNRLKSEFPQLETADNSKKTRWSLGASNIRKLLKAKFPNTRFSVTSSAYSMGCSITVSYEDSPPIKAVEEITDRFRTAGFDPIQDLKTYLNNPFADVFGGADYINVNREPLRQSL